MAQQFGQVAVEAAALLEAALDHQGWDHKTAYRRHDLELARLEVEHTALQEKIKGLRVDCQGYSEMQAEIEANKSKVEMEEELRLQVKDHMRNIESDEREGRRKMLKEEEKTLRRIKLGDPQAIESIDVNA